jgi:hypothetical protein
MTKLLKQAFDVVRQLPAADQDDIARAIIRLAGCDDSNPVPLTPDEQTAVRRSRKAAARGEFATSQQVTDVWAKHGQ